MTAALLTLGLLTLLGLWCIAYGGRLLPLVTLRRTPPSAQPVFDRLAKQRGFTLAEPSLRRPSPGRPLQDTPESGQQ